MDTICRNKQDLSRIEEIDESFQTNNTFSNVIGLLEDMNLTHIDSRKVSAEESLLFNFNYSPADLQH